MSSTTLLDLLRSKIMVDCDTCDLEVARNLGPFEDCTANQAIAFAELQKPQHHSLLSQAVVLSSSWEDEYSIMEEKAVQVAMVSLALQIAPYIRGTVHIQVNPFYAYSTKRQIDDASRIVNLFKQLDPGFDRNRVCIKIPSTWEGLQACRRLEKAGVKTLATTLFSIEQAALAGEVGCTYIAPYVNELKVHFDRDYHDQSPQLDLCLSAQRYYEAHSIPTQVLPASLTSIQQVMALAGVHRITVAAPLLEELSSIPSDSSKNIDSLFAKPCSKATTVEKFVNDEAAFRLALTRNKSSEPERKITQALNIFCDVQQKLENLVREVHKADQ